MKDIENYDFSVQLIENSTTEEAINQTNIKKLFEAKSEESENLDETNSSGNLATYKSLITKVIKRVRQISDLEYFCSVIVPKTPVGVIPVYGEKLVGKQSADNTVNDNIKVFQFASTISTTVGATITNGTGGSAEVLYIEDNTLDTTGNSVAELILVKITAGTFASGDTVSSINLDYVYSNVHSMNQLLPNYIGDYSTTDGEVISDSEEVDFQLILKDNTVTTKDLRTIITRETLADLLRMYRITFNNTIVDSLSAVLADKTRQRIFTYMRNNAVSRPDIVLTNSYGTGAGLKEVYGDLVARINQSIGKIGTATGISAGKYSVIGSSNVIAGIKTFYGNQIKEKNGISFLPDDIALIEDGYCTYDYLLVTLRGPNNNSAVIHTPYDVIINSAKDPVDFKEKIVIKSRNNTINNPLMDLASLSANPMMEFSYVDASSLVNTI